ncbi:hypothetical protein PLESTB_000851600 [Pleodorina starrii]|uniref:Uncharacterized protein n=1 Tax=Pleodorina starrii TaxID=330485 RepID=A0A9W6BL78_9CHLO|nr:hypothetical protein PLESTB_000851600 [Pleodorina starrii]GLC71977.1 hypothetical protein PLESTF_001191200 [Pleodorina starrii]
MAFTLRSSSRLCHGPAASSQRRASLGLKARSVLSPLQVMTRSELAVTSAPRPWQAACATNSTGKSSTSSGSTSSPLASCIKGSRGNNSGSGIVKHVRFQLDDIATTAPAMEVRDVSGGAASSSAAAAECTPAAADCDIPSGSSSSACDLGACWGPQQLGRALSEFRTEVAQQAAGEPSHRRTTESQKLRTAGAGSTKASRTAQKRPAPMRF